MRIDDLREVLHEQADTVQDPNRYARVGEVHRRIGAAGRRRRTGATAAAAAAVAVAALGWAALAPDPAPDPAPDRGPARTDSATYPEDYAGRTLLASATGEPGDTAITLDVPAAPDGRVFLTSTCSAPRATGLRFRVALGGRWVVRGRCDDTGGADPLGTGGTLDLGDRAYADAVDAQGHLVVRMRVVRPGSGAPAAEAPVELSAALYALPDPVGELAGQPLDEQLYYDGTEWTLVSWGESDPGASRRSAEVTGPGRYVAVVAAGPGQRGVAQVVVNGVPGVRFQAGGSTTLDAGSGARHEVEVRLTRGSPSSVLGIALYRPAD